MNYISVKLLLNQRNGCLERPAEVFGVSWAQLVLGLLPATGTGGVSGRRGAKYCHLSLTGTKMLIYPERDW